MVSVYVSLNTFLQLYNFFKDRFTFMFYLRSTVFRSQIYSKVFIVLVYLYKYLFIPTPLSPNKTAKSVLE